MNCYSDIAIVLVCICSYFELGTKGSLIFV